MALGLNLRKPEDFLNNIYIILSLEIRILRLITKLKLMRNTNLMQQCTLLTCA